MLLKCTCFLPLNHCEDKASSLVHIHACFGVSSLIGDALYSIQQRLLVPVGAELELSPGIIAELNDSHLSKTKLGAFIKPVVLDLCYAEFGVSQVKPKNLSDLEMERSSVLFPTILGCFYV